MTYSGQICAKTTFSTDKDSNICYYKSVYFFCLAIYVHSVELCAFQFQYPNEIWIV